MNRAGVSESIVDLLVGRGLTFIEAERALELAREMISGLEMQKRRDNNHTSND
ncbi:hypothetical protein [Lentilactobacillus senioris]|uniref:hypothetical protein n=1 Tax=Lentilactobacillus senioris TaxID=931534 RepID=UPI003D2937FB